LVTADAALVVAGKGWLSVKEGAMKPVKDLVGYLLLLAGVLVTAVRIVVVFSGTTDGFWTSGVWETLMVVLMAVALVYVLVAGFLGRVPTPATEPGFQDPAVIRYLFNNPGSATFWAMVRFYVGFVWFSAGYAKIIGKEGDWMTNGTALKGFWTAAVTKGAGPTPAYDWWHNFLDFMLTHEWYTWFAKLIAIGEFAVGIALLLGVLVGIAAFFGGVMNFSYMLTGIAGVNPLMFALTVLLIVAWKVAGWFGADRYLLPLLGTPWQPGTIVTQSKPKSPSRAA
jgi:thiosulfate dehydrogenase [quinone] large subunit